jgi:hypothetical protein
MRCCATRLDKVGGTILCWVYSERKTENEREVVGEKERRRKEGGRGWGGVAEFRDRRGNSCVCDRVVNGWRPRYAAAAFLFYISSKFFLKFNLNKKETKTRSIYTFYLFNI